MFHLTHLPPQVRLSRTAYHLETERFFDHGLQSLTFCERCAQRLYKAEFALHIYAVDVFLSNSTMATATTTRTTRTLPDVPDILYHVFSYLDPVHQFEDDAVYESRRSLAIAARTCQGFTGPALDVLWRRLPDDQPLADLLCALEIGEMEKPRRDLGRNKPGRYRLPNQDEGGYRISGAAEEYEQRWKLSRGYDIKYFLRRIDDPRTHPGWPRFMEYTSRVRTITLFSFDGPGWCGIWEDLRSRTEGAPILPKLSSVAFRRLSTGALTPGALTLISPSVRKLNVNLESACTWPPLDDKLRCLFSQCFNSAPEIEKLRLEVPPSLLGAPLLRTRCSYVRHLDVFPQLDFEELLLLRALPALQSLSISLSSDPDLGGAALPLPFEAITTLVVEGTWASIDTVLNVMLLPSMNTLSITGWDYGEPAAELAKTATQCFRTISTRHTTISSLSISSAPGRMPPSSGCVHFPMKLVTGTFSGRLLDLAHPLLSLSGLRHLSLGFPSYFDVACTPADWRAVAESLRTLEAFHLAIWPYFGFAIQDGGRRLHREQERPRGGPLDALAHFARSCPRLRILHLPAMELVDQEGPGAALAVPRGGDEPHGLRTLVVPKVLLPPGRSDLAGKVSEVVGAAFPLVASAFRQERLVVEGNWAVVQGALGCPECSRGSKLTFA